MSRIRVIAFGTDLISLRVAYPDLARRYDLQGETKSPNDPDCMCRNATEAVIAGFEWPAHFRDAPDARVHLTQNQSACLAQVRASCGSIALEERRDGAIIGALGVGVR